MKGREEKALERAGSGGALEAALCLPKSPLRNGMERQTEVEERR